MRIHMAIYNATIHSSTGFSPNVVQFGRALPLIIDNWDFTAEFTHLNKGPLLHEIISQTRAIWKHCFENILKTQEVTHKKINAKRKMPYFKTGDVVYVVHKNLKSRILKGPYYIVKSRSKVTMEIQHLEEPSTNTLIIHINRLIRAPPRKGHLIEHQTDPTRTPIDNFQTSTTPSSICPNSTEISQIIQNSSFSPSPPNLSPVASTPHSFIPIQSSPPVLSPTTASVDNHSSPVMQPVSQYSSPLPSSASTSIQCAVPVSPSHRYFLRPRR